VAGRRHSRHDFVSNTREGRRCANLSSAEAVQDRTPRRSSNCCWRRPRRPWTVDSKKPRQGIWAVRRFRLRQGRRRAIASVKSRVWPGPRSAASFLNHRGPRWWRARAKLTHTGQLGEVIAGVDSSRDGRFVVPQPLRHAGAWMWTSIRRPMCTFHVPEGATPKDGPSAGRRPCARPLIFRAHQDPGALRTVAHGRGEITLRGEVLPIGVLLKEKLSGGAPRAGITTRADSRRQHQGTWPRFPDNIKEKLDIPVGQVDR